ncbi:alpha/beta hydrolase [Sphingomonas sp. ID0503]|uniref:alpha/beta hydrolase n=1 Tax=Sphingomonas sp. ID0503 TaxID=3399691 RepID=UPI003AFA0FC9
MADITHDELIEMNRDLLASWLADPNYTYDDFRRIFEEWLAQFPIPEGTRFEDADADGVSCIWADGASVDNSRVVVHFHSGGYLLGSAASYKSFGGLLSAATGARVLLVDYRLAPENAHPAAVEDALTVYRWLLNRGSDPAKLALSGDSAGGGLALIALQQVREAGLPLPGCALAISPLADFTASGESRTSNAALDPLVTTELLESMAITYCGDRDRTAPTLSPLFGNWTGLPPVLVIAGEIEVFRDDGKLCVEAALRSGVDARFHVGAKMVHIYPVYADRLPEAREALAEIGQFVRDHTGERLQ